MTRKQKIHLIAEALVLEYPGQDYVNRAVAWATTHPKVQTKRKRPRKPRIKTPYRAAIKAGLKSAAIGGVTGYISSGLTPGNGRTALAGGLISAVAAGANAYRKERMRQKRINAAKEKQRKAAQNVQWLESLK